MNVRIFFGVACVAKFFVSSQIESFGDFDQVETYTRILLHTKNGSILGGPRADSGPLIIDYPFPIHHSPLDYHLHQSTSPEFARPPADWQHPQYSHVSSQYSSPPETGTHEKLSSLYHHLSSGLGHHSFLQPHKKKKFYKKSSKYLVPLIITLVAKIAHLLPTLKLILLALFSLMLFAKKAFLVSVGTFLLVLYEHFWHKSTVVGGTLNLWKDRGQAHTAGQEVHPVYGDVSSGDHKAGSDWWALEGANGTKITPREGEKWRRWWAPQVKRGQPQEVPPQLEEASSLRERIRNNIKRLFGTRDGER